MSTPLISNHSSTYQTFPVWRPKSWVQTGWGLGLKYCISSSRESKHMFWLTQNLNVTITRLMDIIIQSSWWQFSSYSKLEEPHISRRIGRRSRHIFVSLCLSSVSPHVLGPGFIGSEGRCIVSEVYFGPTTDDLRQDLESPERSYDEDPSGPWIILHLFICLRRKEQDRTIKKKSQFYLLEKSHNKTKTHPDLVQGKTYKNVNGFRKSRKVR